MLSTIYGPVEPCDIEARRYDLYCETHDVAFPSEDYHFAKKCPRAQEAEES